MKVKLLPPVVIAAALAACGQSQAANELENDLPVDEMVVSDAERSQQVEADVRDVAAKREAQGS